MMETTIAMMMGAALLAPAQCDPAPGTGTLVSVQPVVLQTASGLDETTTGSPPPSDASVVGAQPFVIELWAQQAVDDPALGGLNCVFSDLAFDSGVMTCNTRTAAPNFVQFATGTCTPGIVNETGGCTFTFGLGVTPNWVRIATVDMTADAAAVGTVVQAGSASTQISILICGNVPDPRIAFNSVSFDIDLPCSVVDNCNDGQFCNGVEVCNPADPGAGVDGCVPGIPVDCAGQVCDEITDTCVDCVIHANCDDTNPCTDDFCLGDGTCLNNPDATNDPSDALVCNGTETCEEVPPGSGNVVLVPGTPVVCDDSDPCTDGTCEEPTGACVFVGDVTNDPDDNNVCNGVDTCQEVPPGSGTVVVVPGTPLNCNDLMGCTLDGCHPVNGCFSVLRDWWCDDFDVCNGTEVCDGVNVAADGCAPGTPLVCDDALFCNGQESCDTIQGCLAGTPPVCADTASCTQDSCDDVLGCVFTPVHSVCDDLQWCTGTETCDPGNPAAAPNGCVPGTPFACDDGVDCTTDLCNNFLQECFHNPINSFCSNGVFCDGVELCDQLLGCGPGTPVNCDDGVFCTLDSCNEAGGACDNVPLDSNCDDGLLCTGIETCDPTSPFADAQGCASGTPITCDDSVACTNDFCDEAAMGCVYSTECTLAAVRSKLEWRPAFWADAATNDIIEAGLYLVPDDALPNLDHLVAGVDAVIEWDPLSLELLGVVNNGPYPWVSSDFPDDVSIDNLNVGVQSPPLGIPFNDGNALYVAQAQGFPPPIGIGPVAVPPAPQGILVTTFQFRVIDGALLNTQFAVVDHAGPGSSTCSHVFFGGVQFRCLFTGLPCDNQAAVPCPDIPNDVCFPQFTIPSCDVGHNYGSASVLGPCEVPCGDVDGNGVSDDNCQWFECLLDQCTVVDRPFGDAGGAFGACPPDGFANIHDANHALTCFAGANTCDSMNIDVGGAFGACPADGFCNIHDRNHALTAFSGANACSCPLGAAPEFEPTVVDSVTVSSVSERRAVRPGDEISVDVFIDQALDDLFGYQLDTEVTGGRRGQLELVGIAIADRDDHVFLDVEDSADAFNVEKGQMLKGLTHEGASTPADGYLATFTYRVSADAVGTFVVDVHQDRQTYLIASHNGKIDVESTTPAVIVVTSDRATGVRPSDGSDRDESAAIERALER